MQTTSPKTSIRIIWPALIIPVMFLCGWLFGKYGGPVWGVVKQTTIDSYINRYRVMSDSERSTIVYYVSASDSITLYALADQSAEILEVTQTRIKDLYDVKINYDTRVTTVRSLRSTENIDAVITVPLICH